MTWIFVRYSYRDEPVVQFYETEAQALHAMREEAQAYLDAGETPPFLDDWCVARVTHNIERRDVPFGDSKVEVLAA